MNEGTTDSYLHYTKDWIARVNRGGLFKVHDQTYKLFVSLEMKVRQHLAFLFHAETRLLLMISCKMKTFCSTGQ